MTQPSYYLLDKPENIEIGMEAFFSLPNMSGYFNGFIDKFSSLFNARSLVPVSLVKTDYKTSVFLIKKYTKLDLEHFTVIVPEYVDSKMNLYLDMLREVLIHLQDVEKDLLVPLERWVGSMITDPEYSSKIWVNLYVPADRTAKLEIHKEKLASFFSETKSDHMTNRPFFEMYDSAEDFDKSCDSIENLTKLTLKFLDGKLSKRATDVAKQIHKLSEKKEVANDISEIPYEKIKPIIDLTLQIAKELELLSIVMFQVKCASYATEETIKKINEELK